VFTGFRKITGEVVRAVLPVILAVTVLQFTVVFMPAVTFVRFLVGGVMVVVGLVFFLQGVKVGLLPVGEAIGSKLPEKGSMVLLLGTAFVMSFAVTAAEPDVRVLAHQVKVVSDGQIPSIILILMVALGVGVFMVFAILRMLFRVPIAYLLLGGYLLVFLLSFVTPSRFVPIAFDGGGVTTGPMTVPFILAFGIGVGAVLGGQKSFAESFGFIGIASIGPIISVMLLGVLFG
jgi:hypothetical protein